MSKLVSFLLLAGDAGAFSVVGFPAAPATGVDTISRQQEQRHRAAAQGVALQLSDAPSDTSSDGDDEFYQYQDIMADVESDAQGDFGDGGQTLVSNVMDLVPSNLGEQVSSETRAAINEALYKLEALNPTKEPTVSPLLNGVWSLRYVGGYAPDWALPSPTRDLALFLYSGGYSPGIFALSVAQRIPAAVIDVGNLEIAISRSQPRVEASVDVKVLGQESAVKVFARLEVESDVRLRETYESASALSREIPIPQMLQYSRDMYVTYLDEDLLVIRDGTGVPEVLTRKENTFSQNWGTEPSSLDDMNPHGEE